MVAISTVLIGLGLLGFLTFHATTGFYHVALVLGSCIALLRITKAFKATSNEGKSIEAPARRRTATSLQYGKPAGEITSLTIRAAVASTPLLLPQAE